SVGDAPACQNRPSVELGSLLCPTKTRKKSPNTFSLKFEFGEKKRTELRTNAERSIAQSRKIIWTIRLRSEQKIDLRPKTTTPREEQPTHQNLSSDRSCKMPKLRSNKWQSKWKSRKEE